MSLFRVVALSQSGVAILESQGAAPIRGRLDLYANGKKAAVVVDTIASVRNPLYLAQPLVTLQKGMNLTPKR